MAPPKKPGKADLPPIIVKKITIVAGGHHGGAWKVAYADFVTAMMAFFLMLWLLGATTEKQRKGIADYFTPTLIKTKAGSAGSNGLLGGSSITDVDNYPHRAGQTGTKAMTIPRDTTGGPKEGGTKIKRVARVQGKLEQKLAANEKTRKLQSLIKVMLSPDGIRIDLVDNSTFSMFQLGTTVLTPDATLVLNAIAETVRDEIGGISIVGHTDSLKWRPGMGTNNWSLSAGRAEATRQAMIRTGVAEGRYRRIAGVADREPLVKDHPDDPRNRRISILMMD